MPHASTISSLLDGLDLPHELNAPLAPKTWYKVGGPAPVLAHPRSVDQLSALAKRCHERGVRIYVLGSGANLLVADEGVDGVVVQLDDDAFSQVTVDRNRVTAGAGFDLMKLVLDTAKRGLAGLEVVAGIPASIGGAVRMNAGGAFGDVGKSVSRVTVMSESGEVYERTRDDLVFSYRKTNISAPFILSAEFELAEEDPDDLMKRVKEIFLYKKNSQPMGANSAGCAFKNPKRPADDPDASQPLPGAGALIDRAGLKGYRIGGAEVSDKHGNFIFAHDGCKAADLLALMAHCQTVVYEKFGIRLEREVAVWPTSAAAATNVNPAQAA